MGYYVAPQGRYGVPWELRCLGQPFMPASLRAICSSRISRTVVGEKQKAPDHHIWVSGRTKSER